MEYYKNLGLEPIHYYCEVEQDFKLEEFRAVKGYEGYYEVSDLGRVKSLERVNARGQRKKAMILSPRDSHGYGAVRLYKKAISKYFKIYKLVAIAFLGHEPCGYSLVVNHKDLNRRNDRSTNLEIVTARENSNKKHIESSSRYVGVYWATRDRRWVAQITKGSERIHLGSYTDEVEASQAYELALKEIDLS